MPLTPQEIARRLANREDVFVERKSEGFKPEEMRRAVVAFANSVPPVRPGLVVVGVEDKTGKVIGVKSPTAVEKRLHEVCDVDCYPSITHAVTHLVVEGRDVVALEVPASSSRPHFAGQAYIRDGARSVRASDALFRELIDSRNSIVQRLLEHRGKTISVVALHKSLGRPGRIPDAYYRESPPDAVIEDADTHIVQLYLPSSGRRVSEPLRNVTIHRDEEKHRLLLVIEEK
jgi:hypothetical protein